MSVDGITQDFLAERNFRFEEIVEKDESAREKVKQAAANENDILDSDQLEAVRKDIDILMEKVKNQKRRYYENHKQSRSSEKLVEPTI